MASKIAAVDLDGVIAEYHGWKGPEHFGLPLAGAREGLERLRAAGWKIVVHTTRAAEPVRDYLIRHGLPFDGVNEDLRDEGGNGGKPIATVYLDDRAVAFRGSWERAVERVLRHRPWNRPGGETRVETSGPVQGRIYYHKLVRDRIPEVVAERGARARCRRVEGAELRRLLVEKMREELDEYERASRGEERLGELVDMLEVWRACVDLEGIDPDAVETRRVEKARRRGAFRDGWVLEWVDESD